MKNVRLAFRELLFKYDFVKPAQLVFALCVLCALCGKSLAQDFKQIHPGVEHAQVDHKIGEDPVKINLLRLDLTKVRLDVHKANDRAVGLETTSSIAIRKGAVAAINAGFFRLDKTEFAGEASDALVIDGNLLSEGIRERITLFIDNNKSRTQFEIRHSRPEIWLESEQPRFRMLLSGINRPYITNELVLYDRNYALATKNSEPRTKVVFLGCRRGNKRRSAMADCTGVRIIQASMGVPIPVGGFVISAPTEATRLQTLLLRELTTFSAYQGKKKQISFRVEDPLNKNQGFPQSLDAVAGVPQLIKNGNIDITWEQEKASRAFVFNRHPRTAVAKMKDGKFLMITVDGRQPGVSVGMTLLELAEYLHSLGAVDAMNLDGGGSTTMVLDGKVVNKPSDPTGERKIGDAIVVTLRKKK